MIVSPSKEHLNQLIRHQLNNLFLLDSVEGATLDKAIPETLNKVEQCFNESRNKYYRREGEVFFSIFHSGQYCIFLYFLSRTVFLSDPINRDLADKIYYLNRSLNAVDLYYEVAMPDAFHLDHPLGSVIGRAKFGNNFSFAQHCTIGNNKGIFPTIGNNVSMMSGSKIIGNCIIGDNVIVSANAYIKDHDIPPNSMVFGSSPNLVIKPRHE